MFLKFLKKSKLEILFLNFDSTKCSSHFILLNNSYLFIKINWYCFQGSYVLEYQYQAFIRLLRSNFLTKFHYFCFDFRHYTCYFVNYFYFVIDFEIYLLFETYFLDSFQIYYLEILDKELSLFSFFILLYLWLWSYLDFLIFKILVLILYLMYYFQNYVSLTFRFQLKQIYYFFINSLVKYQIFMIFFSFYFWFEASLLKNFIYL